MAKELHQYTKYELAIELAKRGPRKARTVIKLVEKQKLTSPQGTIKNLRFKSLARQFPSRLKRLEELGTEPFVMPFWDQVNQQVKSELLPQPPKDFLNIRAIRDTMFVDGDKQWLDTQIRYLQKCLADFAQDTIEDSLGAPKLLSEPYNHTSHNTIHHLYHIYYYLNEMKLNKSDLKTVVEWGGGYGNFAKLWMRQINPNSTYIIIDTSLFCSIQWLYLSSVLGKDQVQLLDTSDSKIEPGKVNLVPLALMDKLNIKGDLFVSTWGLSESLNKAQDYVVRRGWFGCPHLLLGFQNSTEDLEYASRLGKLAQKADATIMDIKFIPNNHYAFK